MVLAKAKRRKDARWVLLVSKTMSDVRELAKGFNFPILDLPAEGAAQDEVVLHHENALDLDTLVEIKRTHELQNLDMQLLLQLGMIAFTEWTQNVEDVGCCFRQTGLCSAPESNYIK